MKTLMNRLILLASLLPGLLFAATTTLNPVADAHVRASTTTSNYGALTALYVRTDTPLANQYDTYLKFSLGTLSNVTSAKVRLYAKLTVAGSVVTNLHSVADTTWTETDLTWSNKRTLGGVLGSTSVAVTTPAWHEIDITAYVQSELAANRTTLSLALHNPNTSQVIQITSKEAVSNKPELVITTNTLPTVSLTAPINGATYTAPASITLSATASDADGPVSLVEFYNGAILLGAGVEAAGVWSYTWSNVAAGSYALSAKAYDSNNASSTSSTATVTVNTALKSAADAHVRGAATTLYTNYGTVTPLRVRNDASPANQYDAYLKFDLATLTGAVTKATLRLNGALSTSGSVSTSVYGVTNDIQWTEADITWNNKPALGSVLGSATISGTAFAWYEIDVTGYVQGEFGAGNKLVSLGLHNLATSTQITQIVSKEGTNKPELIITTSPTAPPGVYYVYADHLNTPRLITDQTNRTVWRWESDPFGTDVTSEDVDGDGVKFGYNLRFPGQYFDKETGLHYNYFRDYDPGTGRYVQSDPIGLKGGGFSTYAYVDGNPISRIDPLGLAGVVIPGPVPLPLPGPVTPVPGSGGDDGSMGGIFPPGTLPTTPPFSISTTSTAPYFPTKDPVDCDKQLQKAYDQCQQTCQSVASGAWCRLKAEAKYFLCKRRTVGNGLSGMDDFGL